MVEFCLNASSQVALVGQECGSIDLEQVGRETLDTHNGVGAVHRSEVLPDAGLQVEERRDGAAVERLHLGPFDVLAETAFTFGLEPELAEIAAVIALQVE